MHLVKVVKNSQAEKVFPVPAGAVLMAEFHVTIPDSASTCACISHLISIKDEAHEGFPTVEHCNVKVGDQFVITLGTLAENPPPCPQISELREDNFFPVPDENTLACEVWINEMLVLVAGDHRATSFILTLSTSSSHASEPSLEADIYIGGRIRRGDGVESVTWALRDLNLNDTLRFSWVLAEKQLTNEED